MKHVVTLLCCLAMPLLVSASVKEQSLDKIVAVVNEEVITQSDFEQQYQAVKNEIKHNHAAVPSDEILRKQVLSRLMDISIQLQLAKASGVNIDDAALNNALQNIAQRHKMTVAQLHEQVEKQGLSYQQYRENIRKELAISQLQQQTVASKIQISDEEVKQFLQKYDTDGARHSEYHVKDILIALPEEPSSEQVSDAKAKALTIVKKLKSGTSFSELALAESANDEALQGGDLGWRKLSELPEIFVTPIKTMKPGAVTDPIRTDNGFHIIHLAEVRGNREQHLVDYFHVRHILVRNNALTTEREIEAKLNSLRERIQKGESFASLAKLYSDDFATTSEGGDLGWVGPGKTVPEFEAALKTLPLNTVSSPIKTSFGWHIVEVLGKKVHDDSQLVKENKARDILFRKKFQAELETWLQAIRGAAYTKEVANV